MPKKRTHGDERIDSVAGLKMTTIESTLQIQPLSHVEFRARWSLSQDALDAGLQTARQDEAKPNLVLRAYSLTAGSAESDFSERWNDFTINSLKGNRCFILPKPTPKLRAAIGLINDSGRFSPLVRGKAVTLPLAPDQLAALGQNPGLDKSLALGSPASQTEQTEQTESLETSQTAGHFGYHSPPSQAWASKANTTGTENHPAEDFFNIEDDIWTESAPVELRAEFVVFGKITPGAKLLIGSRIIEAAADGTVEWKQQIGSFKQVWPLLQQALEMPSIEAGPSLEFFQKYGANRTLIELRGALKITGKVNHPEYFDVLPNELNLDANGRFKLSRILPNGAVILPGLSLIAEA